ncbi:MAG: hypothetical protein LC794_08495 [Acidobacteria bacterium]|nr:hypothetical protein [Acidobacteriota bacterium]
MLTGLLELDGVVMAGCRVLLLSGDMTRLLESTTTDAHGVFRFAVSETGQSRVVVLAKISHPVLSISYRTIEPAIHGFGPHRISLDSTTELFGSIRGHVVSDEPGPPYVLVHIDPVRLIGIPEPLEKFFRTVDANVVESWFSQVRLDGDRFAIRVQNGTYRIDAQYFSKRESQLDEHARNYSLRQATADGEETIHFEAPFASFTLNVERDREVEMKIGAIHTDN